MTNKSEKPANETPRFTPAHRETLEKFQRTDTKLYAGQRVRVMSAIESALAEIDRLTMVNESLFLDIMKLRNRGAGEPERTP